MTNERHKVIFDLLFHSGMRIGELLALDFGDSDFEKNLIHITKNRPTMTLSIYSHFYRDGGVENADLFRETLI